MRILSNDGAWNGRGLGSTKGLSAGKGVGPSGFSAAGPSVPLHEKPAKLTRTSTTVSSLNRCESFQVRDNLTTISGHEPYRFQCSTALRTERPRFSVLRGNNAQAATNDAF